MSLNDERVGVASRKGAKVQGKKKDSVVSSGDGLRSVTTLVQVLLVFLSICGFAPLRGHHAATSVMDAAHFSAVPFIAMCVQLEELNQVSAKLLVIRMLHDALRSRGRGNETCKISPTSPRTVGHANDSIGEKERFIHVMGNHQGSQLFATPEFEKDLLQLEPGE